MEIENKIVGAPERAFDNNFGNYWVGKVQSANKGIITIANDYKKNQLKKMKALNPRVLNPRSRKYIRFEDGLIITVKKDGEFNLFYYDVNSEPFSIFVNTPNGRVKCNLPVSREIHQIIEDFNTNREKFEELRLLLRSMQVDIFPGRVPTIAKLVLAGELHANIVKANDRPRVSDFLKISRTPENFEELEKIDYDIFDILSINDISLQGVSYEFRLKIIDKLFPRIEEIRVKIIKYKPNVKGKKAHEIFNQWVEQENQEGIIIHDKYNKVFKVKKVHTIDAVVIGFVEMLKEKRIRGHDSISALLTALMRADGSYQVLAIIGGGFSEEQRIDYYNLLKDDIVDSKYKETNREGRAFHFVKPKYVVEMRYLDMITENYEGLSKLKMALEFRNDEWWIKRVVPFVALINPYHKMLRTEVDLDKYPSLEYANPKTPIYEDVKIDQVFNVTYLETPRSIAEIQELPQSETLFKIIYNVKWGGVESAKKILIWKTNKNEIDNTYPKFVVYYADYNYLRSKPLEQQIYPFNSLNKAIRHLSFIYKRPDNPQKGFFDAKTQTTLKRSILTPPHKLYVHDEIKELLKQELEPDVLNLYRH